MNNESVYIVGGYILFDLNFVSKYYRLVYFFLWDCFVVVMDDYNRIRFDFLRWLIWNCRF